MLSRLPRRFGSRGRSPTRPESCFEPSGRRNEKCEPAPLQHRRLSSHQGASAADQVSPSPRAPRRGRVACLAGLEVVASPKTQHVTRLSFLREPSPTGCSRSPLLEPARRCSPAISSATSSVSWSCGTASPFRGWTSKPIGWGLPKCWSAGSSKVTTRRPWSRRLRIVPRPCRTPTTAGWEPRSAAGGDVSRLSNRLARRPRSPRA